MQEGKEIQALIGNETNKMHRVLMHHEISSSFPHDERPLLRNSVTMTERLRDAGMEANAKYYPVSLIGISPYL